MGGGQRGLDRDSVVVAVGDPVPVAVPADSRDEGGEGLGPDERPMRTEGGGLETRQEWRAGEDGADGGTPPRIGKGVTRRPSDPGPRAVPRGRDSDHQGRNSEVGGRIELEAAEHEPTHGVTDGRPRRHRVVTGLDQSVADSPLDVRGERLFDAHAGRRGPVDGHRVEPLAREHGHEPTPDVGGAGEAVNEHDGVPGP